MSLFSVVQSATGIIVRMKILSQATAYPKGLTGLLFSSTGLVISTICDNEATATAYTVAGSTIETVTTLGTYAAPTATKCRFKEVDATNHPGLYEMQFANARFAVANAKTLTVSISGAVTNLIESDGQIQLQTFDPYAPALSSAGNTAIVTAMAAKVIGTAPTANTWDEAMAFAQAGIGKNNVAYTPPSGVNTANGVMAVKANDGVATLKTFSAVNQDASGNITSRA